MLYQDGCSSCYQGNRFARRAPGLGVQDHRHGWRLYKLTANDGSMEIGDGAETGAVAEVEEAVGRRP